MTSTIRGASLAFEAAHIEIPLDDLLKSPGQSGLSAPKISPPSASASDVDVEKLGDLALAEILSHARSGRARVRLPLRPTTMKRGPFSFTIPPGSEVVIDLEVEEDVILRQATRGSIVPALKLPLGVSIRGVYLDDEGNILADLAGFPDVNLSWLALNGLRVPASLREVIDMAFDQRDTRLFRPPPTATSTAQYDGRIVVVRDEVLATGVVTSADDVGHIEDKSGPGDDASVQALDLDRLRVEARGVLPHLTPLSLGRAGALTPGPNTVFDIDFSMEGMMVHGDVELVDGTLDVGGLKIRNIFGRGSFVVRLEGIRDVVGLSLQLQIENGEVGDASIALGDGTRVNVENAALENATIDVGWAEGAITWKVTAPNVRASVANADIMMRIGTDLTPVRAGRAQVSGSARAGLDHFLVDLQVDGVDLEVDRVALELGIARLDLAKVKANATGRVKAGTDFGYTFSGTLAVDGAVDDGHIDAGPLQARLVDGSDGSLEIREIAASPDGLEALVARGRLDIRLASGTLPLGNVAALQFSRGGVGRIDLDDIRIQAGEAWPHIRGRANLIARADPVAFQGLVELPSGHGHVDLGGFALERDGRLCLSALRMWVSSEDDAEPTVEQDDDDGAFGETLRAIAENDFVDDGDDDGEINPEADPQVRDADV